MKTKKILIGCLLFRELTGSELYVYELAKGLKEHNYDVYIVSSQIGGVLTEMAQDLGIKVYSFQTLPKNMTYDLIHCQHTPITSELLKIFPITKKICTIHSEVNSLENPIQHFSIFKYITIRPEIKNHIVKNFGIDPKLIEVIYNPIDNKKFNTENIKDEGYMLFVGTIDYLRRNTILDLVQETKKNNQELWLVGKNHGNYLHEIVSNPHIRYFESTQTLKNLSKIVT